VPTLAETADQSLAAAEKLQAEGKHEAAAHLAITAARLWQALAKSEAVNRLTGGKYSPKLPGAMDVSHREAISKGRAKRNPMLRAARDRGYLTLGALAKALTDGGYPVKPSFLSQVSHGDKKMPPDLGRRIRDLTGWEP
jgi:hypothetical protein